MNVKEIEREVEIVENAVTKNIDMKDVQAHIARGIWQVALQLAKLNATAFEASEVQQ